MGTLKVLELYLFAGLLQFDGFVEVVLQGRSQVRKLPRRGEFNPSPGLRMLSNPFENVFRIFEQSALEEPERARLLERDYDRHVLRQNGEARFAPLEFFGQVAVERDLA